METPSAEFERKRLSTHTLSTVVAMLTDLKLSFRVYLCLQNLSDAGQMTLTLRQPAKLAGKESCRAGETLVPRDPFIADRVGRTNSPGALMLSD